MGVVWFVWFGMLLGFEATSLRALGLGVDRVLHFWGVWLVLESLGWRGSWCFGVCPVFAAGVLVGWLWLLGCACGGAGLLFGNCIVNASILQMR